MLVTAANACTGIALLVFALGLVHAAGGRHPGLPMFAAAIRLAVEFLLAGGLLRLASLSTYGALATAAAIVLVRKLIALGLAWAIQAQASGPPPA
jgi:hypothetical protein